MEAGFSDENKLTKKNGIRDWEGKTIRTFFNSNICMHAFKCQPLDELRKKELDDGDSIAADEIARIVTSCLSGALSFEMINCESEVEFESSREIGIIKGGEIRIKFVVESEGLEGQERQPENRVTLCRCGLSNNKPFCAASHRNKANFK